MKRKQLRRSKNNRVIAGVLGGLAEYMDISPVILRIFFVLAGPSTLPLWTYFVLAVLMPSADDDSFDDDELREERDAEWSDF